MGQVLGNLLDNALRHTPAGGTVTIRAVRGESNTAILRVDDTGEGIGPDHLPFIFDRFYRADTARDRERGGAGIGLSIARALVEAHGGTIGARSEGIGHGASVQITLPAKAPTKKRAPSRARKPVE
jgi:signal transduction histidine kinase